MDKILELFKKLLSFLGHILLFILKVIGGFFVTVILIIFLSAGSLNLFSSYMESKNLEEINKEYEWVVVDLNRVFLEGEVPLFNQYLSGDISYYTFLKLLDRTLLDDKVAGVIVKLDGVTLNRAQSEEVGKKIKALSLKKKVIAFSEGLDKNKLMIGSNATNIVMPATASATSNITGYSLETQYYKDLADKVGVKFNVIHMGNYKSYGESYVRNEMSEYAKENMVDLLENVYKNFVNTVAVNRNIDGIELSKMIDEGELVEATPFLLADKKLIDGVIYYEDLLKQTGKEKTISLEEYAYIVNGKDYLEEMKSSKDTKKGIWNKEGTKEKNQRNDESDIALIFLSGEIGEYPSKPNVPNITSKKTIGLIDEALKDSSIKGIVLRVDSPGGSALTAEKINHFIRNREIKKPIYISMGGSAASGGYYISAAGDKVFANLGTVTGSIGVVSLLPNVSELAKKLGVNTTVIERGKSGNLYSMYQELTPEKEAVLQKSMSAVYEEFKGRVSEGRKLPLEYVESVAQGRVWSGEQGVLLKLVDGIATLDEVIDTLGRDLNLTNYHVVEFGDNSFENNMRNYFGFLNRSSKLMRIVNALENLDFATSENEILEDIKKSEYYNKPILFAPKMKIE